MDPVLNDPVTALPTASPAEEEVSSYPSSAVRRLRPALHTPLVPVPGLETQGYLRTVVGALALLVGPAASPACASAQEPAPPGYVVVHDGRAADFGAVRIPPHAWGPEVAVEGRVDRPLPLAAPGATGAVVPESVTAELVRRATGEVLATIPGALLHGQRHLDRYRTPPLLNLARARVADPRQALARFAERLAGSRDAVRLRVRYRTATTAERWVLADLADDGFADTLRVRDFGAVADPAVDNLAALAWTLRAARRYRKPGTVLVVAFDAGVYGYVGPLAVPDSTALVGAGGARLAAAVTDADGYTFRPVEPVAGRAGIGSGTTLRVLDGEAVRGLLALERLAPWTVRDALGQGPTAIYPESGAMYVALRDLALDGNQEGDRAGYDALPDAARERHLRNSPAHSGFVATSHNRIVIPAGQRLDLSGVAVTNYAATGILGHASNTWTLDTVLLGSSFYNHIAYNADGTWNNVTFYGYAWTHWIARAGTYTNVVAHRMERSPVGRTGPELLDARISDRAGALTIRGLYADFRTGGVKRLLYSNASATAPLVIEDAVVRLPDGGSLLAHRRAGRFVLRRVGITVDGEYAALLGRVRPLGAVVEDLRVTTARAGGRSGGEALLAANPGRAAASITLRRVAVNTRLRALVSEWPARSRPNAARPNSSRSNAARPDGDLRAAPLVVGGCGLALPSPPSVPVFGVDGTRPRYTRIEPGLTDPCPAAEGPDGSD